MDTKQAIKKAIIEGDVTLGIELGSTRIKAVLIDMNHKPIASGSHDWENQFVNGVWTYTLDAVWSGLQDSYKKLLEVVELKYDVPLTQLRAIGVSAMMHGYLVFDKYENQLVPFRTWRNTTTEQAAQQLTAAFSFSIPQRWSIAHLYQAMLKGEEHVKDIALITTLAGYVHWKLTGEKIIGVGEASGMFPIDSEVNAYDSKMLFTFEQLKKAHHVNWTLQEILPKVCLAGESGGKLTAEGALRLDPSGQLRSGVLLCPPEGDAGTGMVATNSVAERTGNVSAGTSIFAMVVLEHALSKVYTEIDMVTTPSGKPVAMVHCNNCTSDIDAWLQLFDSFAGEIGVKMDKTELYNILYRQALEGDADCGGLLAYNYFAGEPITGFEEGRPLFARLPNSNFTLANFVRTLLFSAMGTLKIGMEILTEKENIQLDQLLGHGGLFKVQNVGQRLMAAALSVPVTVMESAGEGGAWGIALLAAYAREKASDETLEHYLNHHVFNLNSGVQVEPSQEDQAGFKVFMDRYTKGLMIEQAAVAHFRK
ncbi:xylulokinase [Fusibacter sp. 3D3]|uniref:xylulokinase n=1 Tax=Fusibacter sp. 3D3 TaxID=1048380 RepID=UPI0008537CC7|nr:FGGY-family carbohydrate kinase [Fusibacter sp. 3D3]GAU78887.1 ribulokinase [Fusibacter sp. 3D3]